MSQRTHRGGGVACNTSSVCLGFAILPYYIADGALEQVFWESPPFPSAYQKNPAMCPSTILNHHNYFTRPSNCRRCSRHYPLPCLVVPLDGLGRLPFHWER